jgi:hypothetical protein
MKDQWGDFSKVIKGSLFVSYQLLYYSVQFRWLYLSTGDVCLSCDDVCFVGNKLLLNANN